MLARMTAVVMLWSIGSACAIAREPLVFMGWGGTTQQAQTKAWALPFSQRTGVPVQMVSSVDYGKLKEMVEARDVQWDVVVVESDFALRAGREGLLEPLNLKLVAQRDIDPRFITIYGVGAYYISFVLAYNQDQVANEPHGWEAIFDLKGFPGKRALYKPARPGVIEMALLADGVAAADLYPLDLDRAFRKLDTIKDQILWWSDGEESKVQLSSGEAVMGMFWNGRIFALQKEGARVAVNWKQNLVSGDFLVIPRGAKNKELAQQFLGFASTAQSQALHSSLTGYGPVNINSGALIEPGTARDMPTGHLDEQVNLDFKYWSRHGEDIAARWERWQGQ